MADTLTPVVRALVVGSLLLATTTLMVVAVNTARAGDTFASASAPAETAAASPAAAILFAAPKPRARASL